MRKIIGAISIIAVLSLGLGSCKQQSNSSKEQEGQPVDTVHNSKNSLDWAGVYTGVIPCADCEGINVRMTLNNDKTYQISYQYVGISDEPFLFSGNFTWDDSGNTVILDSNDLPSKYKVVENKLIQLSFADGSEITGELADNYVLTKEVQTSTSVL